MTKVQLQFKLDKPLNPEMMSNLERTSALYGILRLKLSQTMDGLTVEYDATRLLEKDVKAALARAGIAVEQA